MPSKIFSFIMPDGSRNFADWPETFSWEILREYLTNLDGIEINGFLTDHVTEAWIDFSYRGHKFSINNQNGNYLFFVDNPNCADEILLEIIRQCEKMLADKAEMHKLSAPLKSEISNLKFQNA